MYEQIRAQIFSGKLNSTSKTVGASNNVFLFQLELIFPIPANIQKDEFWKYKCERVGSSVLGLGPM